MESTADERREPDFLYYFNTAGKRWYLRQKIAEIEADGEVARRVDARLGYRNSVAVTYGQGVVPETPHSL